MGNGYGKRDDGTEKGPGYYGEIRSKDGKTFSTELGMRVDMDGEELHFPLIHPGMSKEELDHVVNGGKPSRDLVDRAIEHALKRKGEGKSPFADDGEQLPVPDDEKDFNDGFKSK